MHLAQQRYWMDLVNARSSRDDSAFLEHVVPAGERGFEDPPGWPEKKVRTYLLNRVGLLRANLLALEAGKSLDLTMLNLALAESRLEIATEPETSGPARRESLRFLPVERDGNAGTLRVRDTVARAVYYFAQYVDYRLDDPAYPDAGPDRFQIRECLSEDCRILFVRNRELPLYCSLSCARTDR